MTAALRCALPTALVLLAILLTFGILAAAWALLGPIVGTLLAVVVFAFWSSCRLAGAEGGEPDGQG